MRVLYASATASAQSGTTWLMLQTAELLESHGGRSLVALPDRTGLHSKEQIAMLAVPMLPPRLSQGTGYLARYAASLLPSARRLSRIIREHRIDIVHAGEVTDLQAALSARFCRVPLVWSVRASFPHAPGLERLLARIVLRLADVVLVASESVRRELFGAYSDAEGRVRVMHDPPRITEVPDREAAAQWRERLGVPSSSPLVALISKLLRMKGHPLLIQVVPRLCERFPDARVALVGGAVEGREGEALTLQEMAQRSGFADRILFCGQVQDVAGVMSAADVVVHCPDHPDPFPGVVLEAMAVGRPVVGARIGGIPEQVVDGVTGLLVPPNDPGALAEAILALLSDPARRAEMGQAGRQRARTEFSRERYGARLAEIYRQVLAKQEGKA